jgi:hypothetical protein
VADLEPNVGMCERARGVAENAVEALKRLVVFALLLVYYSEAEENFVCLVEI